MKLDEFSSEVAIEVIITALFTEDENSNGKFIGGGMCELLSLVRVASAWEVPHLQLRHFCVLVDSHGYVTDGKTQF